MSHVSDTVEMNNRQRSLLTSKQPDVKCGGVTGDEVTPMIHALCIFREDPT